MTQNSIDFTQIGSTISKNVELSGRSSAHVNVYDVLNAIEECTCPAAEHLATTSLSSNTINGHGEGMSMDLAQNSNGGGWEGLASFLFGPDWYSIPLEGEDPLDVATRVNGGNANKPLALNEAAKKPTGGKSMSTLMSSANAANAALSSAATGKQLPRLAASTTPISNNAGTEKNASFSFDRQNSIGPDNETLRKPTAPFGSSRWNAPYLENVDPFPIVSSSRKDSIANPHRLGNSSKSFHDLALEMEACRSVEPTLKRKSSDGTADSGNKKQMVKKNSNVGHLARAAEEMAMREALCMPDTVLTRKENFYWGCFPEEKSADAKAADVTAAKKDDSAKAESKPSSNAPTRVKFDTSSVAKQEQDKGTSAETLISFNKKPSYVPKFMPSFPPSQENMEHDRQLCVSASKVMGSILSGVGSREKKKPTTHGPSKAATGSRTETDDVRQSVIELGRSTYWGSGWQDKKESTIGQETLTYSIGVAPGQLAGEGVASGESVMKETSGTAAKTANADLQVNPLGRASGSRVSKILEGSMN
jgi:hypothetical protein